MSSPAARLELKAKALESPSYLGHQCLQKVGQKVANVFIEDLL